MSATRAYHELWERADLGIDPDPPLSLEARHIATHGYMAWREAYQLLLDSPEHKAKMERLNATFEKIAERMRDKHAGD